MYFHDMLVIIFALVVRASLVVYDGYKLFGNRIEIVSPQTSKIRAVECIALFNFGLSPYASDVCHQPPLLILLQKYCNQYQFFYVICDMVAALFLYIGGRSYVGHLLKKEGERKNSYAKDVENLLLDRSKLQSIPSVVLTIYLFNPYTVATCTAESSLVISNMINAAILLTTLKGWFGLAGIFVAVSSYISLYPIMFIIPIMLHAYNESTYKKLLMLYPIVITVLSLVGLLFASYSVFNSWDFVHAVYGFILEAPDLTPNMGLFWYFFLEMFDHFRLFFLWVYQINVFIYVIPLAIVFRKSPIFILYVLLSLMSILKSYCNFGDISLPLAMLPLWGYIYKYMRNVLIVIAIFLVTTTLAPCMWYLWIYAGSGNANFFYAVTLVYNAAQIFLLSDVLYAFLKYEYHLFSGLSPKTKDGKEGVVVMK